MADREKSVPEGRRERHFSGDQREKQERGTPNFYQAVKVDSVPMLDALVDEEGTHAEREKELPSGLLSGAQGRDTGKSQKILSDAQERCKKEILKKGEHRRATQSSDFLITVKSVVAAKS